MISINLTVFTQNCATTVLSQSSIDELELKLARKRTILAMYQQLTGICIKFKEEGWVRLYMPTFPTYLPIAYFYPTMTARCTLQIECTALNHLYKRTLQFNLKIPEDEDDCSSKEVR